MVSSVFSLRTFVLSLLSCSCFDFPTSICLQLFQFHLEVNESDLVPPAFHGAVRKKQVEILNYFHVDITPESYYWCAAAEYGARRELILQNKDVDINSSDFRRLLDLLPTIAVRIAGLSPAIIQKNQEKANRVFAGLDYSGILMLP